MIGGKKFQLLKNPLPIRLGYASIFVDSPVTDDFPISNLEDERLCIAGKQFAVGDAAFFVKAVTYGPFAESVDHATELARVRDELGANAIRIYEVPLIDFLHKAAEAGLRVFITIPWTQHVDFLSERSALKAAHETIRDAATRFRGHPAVGGYFVANEIQSTLVRWMGPARVKRALESLIDTGKKADPAALFSYANYPTTEYLKPSNQDFVAFNIYLESSETFGKYLRRLQNLAGDKPLFLAEFGVNTKASGDEKQTEMLSWHLDEVCAAGLAGTTIFAWSDNWKRGGESVTGWDFGLIRRDGTAKPALLDLSKKWEELKSPADGISLTETPKISVIVCTYCGSATLRGCLESLEKLRYPDYEVVVVNDGSDPEVTAIAEKFPEFILKNIDHGGLSNARNLGAQIASGEIFAYTDDDCVAPPDWLSWLAFAYEQNPEFFCLGGPNIPPPPQNFEQACVAASPGGPAHVLLTDQIAEHVPGCNLTVRREAFEAIGGFNPVFWTAGDDVDFCWRLEDAGFVIGFHSAAFVWHHRRFSFNAYLKQQSGYGKAEAMLIPLHPDKFGEIGGARWHGSIYEPARQNMSGSFSRIYQGVFGYEPYQMIYGGGSSVFGYIVGTVQWLALGVALAALGWLFPSVGVIGILMLGTSVFHALQSGFNAPIPISQSRFASRICLSFLAFAQPFVRSFKRFTGSLKHAHLPSRFPDSIGPFFFPEFKFLTRWKRYRFWSEFGVGRDELLHEILHGEERPNSIPVRAGTGWENWDIDLPVGLFWALHLRTVTEYHAAKDQLTRCKLESRPTLLTVIWRIAAIIGLIFLWKNGDLFSLVGITGWAALFFPDLFLLSGFVRGSKCLKRAAKAVGLARAK